MGYFSEIAREIEEENEEHAKNQGYISYDQMMGDLAFEEHATESREHPDLQNQ